MGGSAFTSTTRLSSITHAQLSLSLSGTLSPLFLRFACPAVDPGKVSHGDVDFVVVPFPEFDLEGQLTRLLQPRKVYSNGTLTSFLLSEGGEQVDFLTVPLDQFEMACWLRSYGVPGHILIKCLQKFQLVLTYSGLFIQPAGEVGLGKFFLCSEMAEVQKFLNLSPIKVDNPSRVDLYEYIESAAIDGRQVARGWKLPHANSDFARREQVVDFDLRRQADPPIPDDDAGEYFDVIPFTLHYFGKQGEYAEFLRNHQAVRRRTEFRAELKRRVLLELTPETTQHQRQLITERIKLELAARDLAS